MKKVIFLMMAMMISVAIYSQDRIYKRNGEILEAKVLEIGDYEVKYKAWDNQEGVTYIMEAANIRKVLLANGEVKTYDNDFITPLKYSEQRKRAIKVSFLDPLLGSIQFTYEKSLKPGQALEFSLGYIGLGGDPEWENPKGINLRAGYKISKAPDYHIRSMRSMHALHGTYIRPDIAFSLFSAESWSSWSPISNSKERNKYFAGALLLNFGKQSVIGDRFLIDTYLGVGYGFVSSSNKNEYGYMRWNYGFMAGEKDVPLSLNLGIRLGFAY